MSKSTSTPGTTKKFVIAVHGIGDQLKYDTVKSVGNQFCRYFGLPSAIPLGLIHSALHDPGPQADPLHKQGIYMLPNLTGAKDHPQVGFSEAYWADIPREVVKDGYILEETKRWSRTIAERVRTCKNGQAVRLKESQYETLKRVLAEMIQTVNVLGWISFLAEKAGIFKFRLKKLLNDYAGDVQIVTEYAAYRARILDAFDTAMSRAHAADGEAELYIIAHSEGSVVSLLGLLNAIRNENDPKYAWLRQVRGFMTIGSPIEKHFVLWRDLIEDYAGTSGSRPGADATITWCNYYDHGDPVGSKLDMVWDWLKKRKTPHFALDKKNDMGFSRYIFPGKAHTDYWTDDDVFGHFISSVMRLPKPKAAAQEPEKPKSSWVAELTTKIAPFVAMFAVMVAATHVVYAALTKTLKWQEGGSVYLGNALAVAFLLSGMTVLARVPRLSKELRPRLKAVAFAALSLWLFDYFATGTAKDNTETISKYVLALLHIDYEATFLGFKATTLGMSAAISLVAGASYVAGVYRPLWGLTPLIILGGASAALVEMLIIFTNSGSFNVLGDLSTVWQVLLSSALFLYLWWFAALLFDLVFVWHSYIRTEKMLSR